MNKIYKTIRKGLFGKAVAVSELAKSKAKNQSCVSQSHHKTNVNYYTVALTWISKIASLLLLTAVSNHALAQTPLTYNQTNTAAPAMTVIEVGSVNNLPIWINMSKADAVLAQPQAGSIVNTGTHLILNHHADRPLKFEAESYSAMDANLKQNARPMTSGIMYGDAAISWELSGKAIVRSNSATGATRSYSNAKTSSPESFKTPEYLSSTGLDFIRAADAYALGYTGAGITLGIIDGAVRADHPELTDKVDSVAMPIDDLTGLPYVPNWEYDQHGTHVGGIMAAKRNGVGMHGVAFDAHLASVVTLGHKEGSSEYLTSPDILAFYAARPDIRVINNSFALIIYPFSDDRQSINNVIKQNYEAFGSHISLSVDYDKVLVFGAANEGFIIPNLLGALPRYLPELKSWISVVSVDTGNITTAADGTRTIKPGGVSGFSNLAYKAQLWSVAAPGSNINSLNATDNSYTLMGGTSMATPYVSGALGLVQQAYPWMTGKQLADTVLTTADNSFIAPAYTVLYTVDNGYLDKVTVIIIDNSVAPPDIATLQQWIDNSYASRPWLRDALKSEVAQNGWNLEHLSKEEVFGQGLLDVGKAVRGIARLDTNRMSAADVALLTELGRTYALETFDTKGYFAEFSNDITQRMWNDSYHHPDFLAGEDAMALRSRDVGLRKAGDGLLVLSGTNDYRGATVVDGGSLAVSRQADGSGGVLKYSDVLVRQGGILLGDGEIQQSVINSSLVVPGYRGAILTAGHYIQNASGTLRIGITADGQHTALSAGSASLDGALRFVPAYGFYNDQYRIDVSSVQTTAASGAFNSVGITTSSPTLNFSVLADNGVGHVTIGQQRTFNAYSRYANSTTTANVGYALVQVAGRATGDMQNLLLALDWSDASGYEIAPAMEQLGPGGYDAVARAGMESRRQLNLLLVRRFLNGNALQASATGSVMSGEPVSSDWQAWAMPFGSYDRMNASGGSAGFSSSSAGVAFGFERRLDSELVMGFDVALSDRHTSARYAGDAKANTKAASVGGYFHFKPQTWDGAYLMGMARIGFENVDMKRKLYFNGYGREHDSRWTGLTADVLAGGGKDWSWTQDWGGMNAGPLAWLEYGLNKRPSLTEGGWGASALKLNASTYQGFSSVLGAHVNIAHTLKNNTTFSWDFLAGWRHVWRDGSFDSTASFNAYGVNFKSRSDIPGRNGMLAQIGMRASNAKGYFAQLDLRTELFRSRTKSFAGGITFGLKF